MAQVSAIPPGFHTLTPHIVCRGAGEAIDWYKKALGAEEISRAPTPDGKRLIHSLIRIGDSFMMVVDEFPEWNVASPQTLGNSPVTLHMYVTDVDAVVGKAVAAGAKATMPIMDMFWGDRYGKFEDPYGHHWSVATKKRDVSPAEMAEATKQMFSKPMSECK
jgi:uncharacterized glyoxalase superfamily protein PhnB